MPDRKVIQTTIHELGHALNLAHRFEREVGRADSLSHMNYDHLYKLGGHRDEFWEQYRFTFDPDELSFIRHGVRAHVIPGGRAFHSLRYWADGDGGYVPYRPEVPLPWFRLRLAPPPMPACATPTSSSRWSSAATTCRQKPGSSSPPGPRSPRTSTARSAPAGSASPSPASMT